RYPIGMSADQALVAILRVIGLAELFALPFVFVPVTWMGLVHDHVLGLGPFPQQPIAEYLARHLSALYAVHGAMGFALSLDVPRYRPLVRLLGWCHLGLGGAVAWTDVSAGLHPLWAVGEGLVVGTCGVLILVFSNRRNPNEHQRRAPTGVSRNGEESEQELS
ncbi:hypothetical protein J0H58_08765, partial [bacterium]|nr:hypothetical protein [bacterium]